MLSVRLVGALLHLERSSGVLTVITLVDRGPFSPPSPEAEITLCCFRRAQMLEPLTLLPVSRSRRVALLILFILQIVRAPGVSAPVLATSECSAHRKGFMVKKGEGREARSHVPACPHTGGSCWQLIVTGPDATMAQILSLIPKGDFFFFFLF